MTQGTLSAFAANAALGLPAACTIVQAEMRKFVERHGGMPLERRPGAGPLRDAATGGIDG